MSIVKGSFAFRMMYVPQDLPADVLERFTKDSAPTLDKVGVDACVGWVGRRHALDLPISEENSALAGYTTLILRKAERKVPAARLKAECAMVEQQKMQAEGVPFLNKKTRKEIREQVLTHLLPTMEPSLSGVEFVYDGRNRVLFTTATSDKQLDSFTVNWLKATGVDIAPVIPATAAISRKKINVRDWKGTSFTPEVGDESMENAPGEDFLTWLWYKVETGGGLFKDDDNGDFAVQLEGPLLMERKGEGAHETSLRKGLPTISDEAKSALLAGKKLVRAKISIAWLDMVWSFGFDATNFIFRGMRLPEIKEKLDVASVFQKRVLDISQVCNFMLTLFDQFVTVRNDVDAWKKLQEEIHSWASAKTGKK